MITMLILSLVMAVSFVGIAIWKLKELPESISALVYVFRWRWLWTLWIWTVSLLTFIPVIDRLSHIGMEFLGFGALVCLMLCGTMPLFDKEHLTWHWILGISGCILSLVCVYFIETQWLGMWMPCVFLIGAGYVQPQGWLGKATKGKWVLLAECACYISLIESMLM